jgi:type I site-specific restriction-modification system R (restriction) subunit
LRELLNRASGGVVFTTIHKFMPEKGEAMPELSARQNIVVIADEAHRSQYGCPRAAGVDKKLFCPHLRRGCITSSKPTRSRGK